LSAEPVVLVTGAGRGLGRAIGEVFQAHGYRVVASDYDATLLRDRDGVDGYTTAQLDVTDAESIAGVARFIAAEYGRLDVVVNNAGIIRRAPAKDFSEADWNAVIATNLNSPFFLMQAVGKWWIETGKSKAPENSRLKLVNIASLLSFQGGITVPAYAASKHGIAGVTKALSNEWAKERINVNAIAPGYIATENTKALREDPVRNKAILDRIPEGRWGAAEDIAGGCVFLASGDSDYLNGAVLNIDGGWLGR